MQVGRVEIEGDKGAVGQGGAAGQAGEQFFALTGGAGNDGVGAEIFGVSDNGRDAVTGQAQRFRADAGEQAGRAGPRTGPPVPWMVPASDSFSRFIGGVPMKLAAKAVVGWA